MQSARSIPKNIGAMARAASGWHEAFKEMLARSRTTSSELHDVFQKIEASMRNELALRKAFQKLEARNRQGSELHEAFQQVKASRGTRIELQEKHPKERGQGSNKSSKSRDALRGSASWVGDLSEDF